MKLDYNRLSDEQSFNGWSFDKLVMQLAEDAAGQYGTCGCQEPRACIHTAAAALVGLFRIANHRDDCPECASIEARRRQASDQT